jgi:hypothetical protein
MPWKQLGDDVRVKIWTDRGTRAIDPLSVEGPSPQLPPVVTQPLAHSSLAEAGTFEDPDDGVTFWPVKPAAGGTRIQSIRPQPVQVGSEPRPGPSPVAGCCCASAPQKGSAR